MAGRRSICRYLNEWVENIIRVLCNIVTMECSSEVVVFACVYKRGVAGPNEIQNGGKFKPRETFCITSQRITDITHSQNEYILGVADEYNPRHVKMPPCVIKPAFASAKIECRI